MEIVPPYHFLSSKFDGLLKKKKRQGSLKCLDHFLILWHYEEILSH